MKTNKGLEFFSQNSGKKPALLISVVIVAFILVINGCTKEQIDKSPGDLTGPQITSVSPSNNSTSILSTTPEATFNEQIDESTLSSAFIVRNGDNVIPGTVSYAGMKATFIPSVSFQPSTVYTCTITTSLQDVSGNYLETDYIWSFTTGPAPDVQAPSVQSVTPANNSTSVLTNSTISVIFSEAINVQTISISSFFLKQGNNLIPGTVSYSGNAAQFTPSSALQNGTVYSATVTTSVKDVAGNALGSNYSWAFTTAATVDNIPPTVLSVSPASNTTGVPTNTKPSVTFSEPISQSSVTSSSFTVKQGSTLVPGTISWSGNTATFNPSAALLTGSSYTCTITTAVKDAAGNSLASNYTWTFTTATATDNVAPTVLSVNPLSNATGVATSIKPSVTFSEPMSQSSVSSSSFTLKQGSTTITGTITWSGNTATFTPSAALLPGTSYSCTLTTAVKDVAGNSLASNYAWTFSTATATDNVAPTVLSVNPASNATGVATSIKPSVTFSEPMSQSSVSSSSFTLKQGSTTITGAISWSGNTATFTPSAALLPGTSYSCTITTAVKDVAGNSLATNYSWTFTTASAGKSFSADVVPILNLCNSCHNHSWTPSSNPSTFHANLVNSGHIDLTTPTNGKIYKKVNGGHPSSGVPADKKNILITWILEGSKNN